MTVYIWCSCNWAVYPRAICTPDIFTTIWKCLSVCNMLTMIWFLYVLISIFISPQCDLWCCKSSFTHNIIAPHVFTNKILFSRRYTPWELKCSTIYSNTAVCSVVINVFILWSFLVTVEYSVEHAFCEYAKNVLTKVLTPERTFTSYI